MRKPAVLTLVLSFGVVISGCATFITGPSQKIAVSSEPSGATVLVDEKLSYTTPAKVRLARNRDHILVFVKDGYDREEVRLLHVLSGAVCGNAVLFGLAGLAVDNWTGAQFKLIPGKVHVRMKQSGSK